VAEDGLAAAVLALPENWQGHYFEAVDSTQDEARAAAQRGAPSRSIFVSDFQRAGRGRQGRSWLARPGAALLMSVLFREKSASPLPWRWTSLASVALVEAINELLPRSDAAIKWPNDVMLDDRKVAGVLAEATWNGDELIAIVGVGINVNSEQSDLTDVRAATSLKISGGRDIDRGRLLRTIVEHVDAWLAREPDELFGAWRARLWGRGQRLKLVDFGQEQEVIVLGAERDGSLLVKLADGTEHRTSTGELLP
jgi:BirA family biotin operon repressor/biotin-[acetyl-CoA-carboxylase] ligase